MRLVIGLKYKTNKPIAMKQLLKCFVFIFTMWSVSAQQEVYGVVTDSYGVIESAHIIIKNTMIGATTNALGEFKIQAQPKDTLIVSYIGSRSKEIPVRTSKRIDVKLDELYELDEINIIAYVAKASKRITCNCFLQCETSCSLSADTTERLFFEPPKESFVRLYPNPSVNGIFQLQLKKDIEDCELYVFDIMGRKIQSVTFDYENNVKVDLSSFPSGMYLVSMLSKGKLIETKKALRQ